MFGGEHSPLDKLHLPWKRRQHGDDASSTASEKQPLAPSTPITNKPQERQYYGSIGVSNTGVMRVWDVKMPPAKKTMVHGVLVPTVTGTVGSRLRQKNRRITIEVHSEDSVQDAISPSVLEPEHENDSLHEGEKVVVRILRPTSRGDAPDDSIEEDDHETVSTLGFHAADEESGDWVTRYVLGLDDVEILKARGSHCEIKMGHGSDTQVRHIHFSHEKEATSFRQVLQKLFKLKKKFTEQRVRVFRELSPVSEQGLQIRLLIEIVSGVDLPVADLNTTDAYVIVRLGGSQEVHRTLPIYGTVNPIWTIESGSLFILSETPETFFGSAQGLCFILRDHDIGSANDTLGKVFVSQEDLLSGDGDERKEYELVESASDDKKRPGKLVLRFRKATEEDVMFMERFTSAQKSNISGVYGDETFVQPHVSSGKFLHREHRKVGGLTQNRVKPGPDPSRPEQATKWMTDAEINAESLKPSSKWIEAGSGDIGKLFVEVIGCDGLPNMDTQAMGGGKTDAFASMVYEDCIVNSEVINDTLSPRWMPWTQRAFIFNVMHPSSELMVGVLDYDSPAPMAAHDPIGRVSVDITNFRPGTEYTLTYDLYTSAIVKKRKSKGSIKLRIRLELPNERKAIMAGLQPPPQIYVNMATFRDYKVAQFCIEGKYDVHTFNMDLFAECVEELKGTAFALLPIVQEAAFTVWLWRGHHPLNLRVFRCPPLPASEDVTVWSRYTKKITILLPLHSVVAFIGGVLLVEDYNLFPSFLLFAVAWLLLATSGHIDDNPSPWRHPRSFTELMRALVANSSPVETIEPNQNEEAIQKYLADKAAAEKKREEAAVQKANEEEEEKNAMGGIEAAEDGNEVDMKSPKSGMLNVDISVNPITLLKPILYPMQKNLQLGCRVVRTIRSFLIWEESYYCFWIVILCIIGGLAILFVPWGLLARWTLRIAVWVFLGPWMKLVDIFYMKRIQSTEEQEEAAEARMKAKYQALLATAMHSQVRREDKTKLRDLKRYMFGDYLAVVPRFKEERWLDIPLAASYASPNVAGESYDIVCRKYGQHLTGDMIPRREIDEPTEDSSLKGTKVNLYGTKGKF